MLPYLVMLHSCLDVSNMTKITYVCRQILLNVTTKFFKIDSDWNSFSKIEIKQQTEKSITKQNLYAEL